MADEIVRSRFEAETSGYERAVGQAAKSTEKLADAADKAGKSTKDMGDKGAQSAQKVEAAQKRAATAQDRAADAAGRLRVAQEKLNAARQSKDVGRIVSAEESVAKAQRDVERTAQEAAAAQSALQRELAGSGDSAGKAATRFERLSAAVKDQRGNMEQAGTALLGVGTALTGVTVGVGKAAMDWESAFAGVKKTVDDNAEGYANLSNELRELATTLPTTHTEVAAVAEAAGQLGVAREDIVGFTATMIDLGETTNLTADDAATNIAQISNVMGTMNREGFEGVQRFGAALVALGNDGASTEAEILAMAQRIAGAGATLGATEADVLALSNTLASMGVKAELGGGVTTRVLLKMRTAVDDGGESLSAFAEVAGVSAEEFAATFRSAPVEALDLVSKGIYSVNEAGGNVTATLKEMGIKGTEETQVMLALANSGDLLTDSLELGARAWEENSALADEAAQRYATAESRISVSWNKIKDAAIDAGAAILPVAASLAEGIGTVAEWFGALPGPVQSTLGVLGGIAGVTTLAAGGFLVLAPRVFETVDAMRQLGMTGPRARGALAGVGKAAGGALAITAVTSGLTALYNSTRDAAPGVEKVATALDRMRDSGDAAAVNDLFQFDGIISNVNGLGDALNTVNIDTPLEHIQSFGTGLFGMDNKIAQSREAFESLDQSLSVMDFGEATASFDQLRAEAERLGHTDFSSWSEMEQRLPNFADKVRQVAGEMGTGTTDADLFRTAVGLVGPEMDAVGESGEVAADGTAAAGEAMGQSAEDAQELADALEDALDALRDMGIVPRNAQAANDAYQESLDALNKSLTANGATLDANTKKGRANRQALRDHAEAGLDNAAAMAEAGASQGEITSGLMHMYNSLVENADAMGLSKTEAELYARELLGIPTDVDVKTHMDGQARQIAELTGQAIKDIPPGVQVIADMSSGALDKAFATAEAVKTIPGYKKVDVAVSDNGTPGQIQERVNAITGKTEYVFVDDKGTSHNVQMQIINIDGKDVPVYVGDDGTVYATQGNINGIHGKDVGIDVSDFGSVAEVQRKINGITGKVVQVTTQVTNKVKNVVSTVFDGPGKATGGFAGGGDFPRYATGRIPTGLPRHAMGRLPYTGMGTDRILAVNADGTPVAMVDDGEGIIRESSTRKHPHLLSMVNDDDPRVSAVGRLLGLPGYAEGRPTGREWSAASVSVGIDYERLAASMSSGRAMFRNEQYITASDPMEAAHMSKALLEHGLRSGVAV
ncbi:MAG: phage tail tape measure protein [Micrococcus sp.]|nr:phage tail tape measure protein [Micrococcus sp.]